MITPIIEYLYKTFSDYSLHDTVTGCYCGVCLDNQFNEYVHHTPLKELPDGYIFFYTMAVGILEEDGNDFKYFLPKILEILIERNGHGGHFITNIWKKLADLKPYLNTEEKNAMKRFAEEYLCRSKKSNNPQDFENAQLDLEEAKIEL